MKQEASDRQWTAFRYLAGELPDYERIAFEDQLAEDQLARETLASLVETTQLLSLIGCSAAAPADSRAARRRVPSTKIAWRLVAPAGVALSLALLALLGVATGLVHVDTDVAPPASPTPVAQSEADAAVAMALAWVSTRDSLPAASEWFVDDGVGAEPLERVLTEDDVFQAATVPAPGWMVAGVASMNGYEPEFREALGSSEDR